jgi:DNA-binding GntR family transcriptional regulator
MAWHSTMHERDAAFARAIGQRTWARSVAYLNAKWYYRLNARIHVAINSAAKNPLLSKTYREINARVQSLRFRTIKTRPCGNSP